MFYELYEGRLKIIQFLAWQNRYVKRNGIGTANPFKIGALSASAHLVQIFFLIIIVLEDFFWISIHFCCRFTFYSQNKRTRYKLLCLVLFSKQDIFDSFFNLPLQETKVTSNHISYLVSKKVGITKIPYFNNKVWIKVVIADLQEHCFMLMFKSSCEIA